MSSRLNYLIFGVDTIHLGIISGFAAFIWGAVLLFPGDSFDTVIGYEILHRLASEWVWGFFLFIFGIMQMYVTYYNKHWIIQTVINFIAIILWVLISIVLLTTNPIDASGSIYLILAWISMLRLFHCLLERRTL